MSCSEMSLRAGDFMRRWDDGENARARIEIIPMIDVMMFLLVFFVLISINVIPALGLKTTLPNSKAPEKLEIRKHVVITLARDGTLEVDGQLATLGPIRRPAGSASARRTGTWTSRSMATRASRCSISSMCLTC